MQFKNSNLNKIYKQINKPTKKNGFSLSLSLARIKSLCIPTAREKNKFICKSDGISRNRTYVRFANSYAYFGVPIHLNDMFIFIEKKTKIPEKKTPIHMVEVVICL